MSNVIDLHPDEASVFWGEIAPCEHLVQLYEDEGPFLDALDGFVAGGLLSGEAAIVIATPAHLKALEQRLQAHDIDLDAARSVHQYIPLDAEETLSKFMVGGWPDDRRFEEVVLDVLLKARGDGRKVRAFGEMVALLWAKGHNGATVRLEHLWTQFCHEQKFSLFCAYPKSGFTGNAEESIQEICSAHSKVVNLR